MQQRGLWKSLMREIVGYSLWEVEAEEALKNCCLEVLPQDSKSFRSPSLNSEIIQNEHFLHCSIFGCLLVGTLTCDIEKHFC
jgi:hypothetical protein